MRRHSQISPSCQIAIYSNSNSKLPNMSAAIAAFGCGWCDTRICAGISIGQRMMHRRKASSSARPSPPRSLSRCASLWRHRQAGALFNGDAIKQLVRAACSDAGKCKRRPVQMSRHFQWPTDRPTYALDGLSSRKRWAPELSMLSRPCHVYPARRLGSTACLRGGASNARTLFSPAERSASKSVRGR